MAKRSSSGKTASAAKSRPKRKPLPHRGQKQVARRRQQPSRDRRRTAVAIIDDQALVRDALAHLINGLAGFRVVFTDSEIAGIISGDASRAASLAVVDAQLVGNEMLALSESLAHARREVRVLLLDEFPSAARLRQAQRSGAVGYASKCDSAADLAAALRHLRGGGYAFPARDPKSALWRIPREGDVERRLSLPLRTSEPSPADLTPRERQILIGLAEGLSVKRCAAALEISPNTVDNHKTRLMRKLGVHKTVELTRFALRHGLIGDG